MTVANGGRRRGRIVVGERDPSLTRYAGLAVTGELARRLRLVELIDAELAVERRARAVKVRLARAVASSAGGRVGGVAAGRRRVLLRRGAGPR